LDEELNINISGVCKDILTEQLWLKNNLFKLVLLEYSLLELCCEQI